MFSGRNSISHGIKHPRQAVVACQGITMAFRTVCADPLIKNPGKNIWHCCTPVRRRRHKTRVRVGCIIWCCSMLWHIHSYLFRPKLAHVWHRSEETKISLESSAILSGALERVQLPRRGYDSHVAPALHRNAVHKSVQQICGQEGVCAHIYAGESTRTAKTTQLGCMLCPGERVV